MESIPSTAGPEASLADGQHIDLTEDLGQQLEKIINTYQAAETNPEQEDTEEVTVVKDLDARKDQKLEKKMRKNLGVLFVVLFFLVVSRNVVLILAYVDFLQLSQQKPNLCWIW